METELRINGGENLLDDLKCFAVERGIIAETTELLQNSKLMPLVKILIISASSAYVLSNVLTSYIAERKKVLVIRNENTGDYMRVENLTDEQISEVVRGVKSLHIRDRE